MRRYLQAVTHPQWAWDVGLFIARISRGRTIREFVFGVLLIPLGFTLAWMSIFGNSAIDQVLNHGMVALGQSAIDDPSRTLYLLLETYPWSKTVIAVDRKSTRLNSSHVVESRMPSSA